MNFRSDTNPLKRAGVRSSEARQRWLEGCRRGGQARAKSFTPEYQRQARARVKRESLQAAGRRGQQRLLERHGEEFRAECLAIHRRAHPSDLEIIVMAWLHRLGVSYLRDVRIGPYFADFLVERTVIEVDGEHWHTNNGHHGEDRETRDRAKDEILRALGYTVIRLSEASIRDESARDVLVQLAVEIQLCTDSVTDTHGYTEEA